MIDAEGHELCECGRPRATDGDLARWQSAPLSAESIRPPPAPLPEDELWARALCWTTPGQRRCLMRKRWASDPHIGEARSMFALWARDGAIMGDWTP